MKLTFPLISLVCDPPQKRSIFSADGKIEAVRAVFTSNFFSTTLNFFSPLVAATGPQFTHKIPASMGLSNPDNALRASTRYSSFPLMRV